MESKLGHRMTLAWLAVALLWGMQIRTAEAARIKDIASFTGVRTNPLFGYGLVVGLNGTGDNTKTQFTVNTLSNLLENLGVHVDPTQVKVKNVAAVMVTAKLPPFAKPGSRVDVEVSSIGDAKSLEGGNLLMAPLQGPDGRVYAVAQGPVSTGGFSVSGGSGSSVQKNINTTAFISGGAMVEQDVPIEYANMQQLDLVLKTPDFTTASNTAAAINSALGPGSAQAVDAGTIKLQPSGRFQGNLVDMMTQVEALDVPTDVPAKIVINERTGTIVMGENVRILPVAIAHGNLTVQISEQKQVSQPLPFSQGQTAVTPQTNIQVQEGKASLSMVGGGATIGQVIQGLNAIGATPRDLISILQAIKAAGALQAELEII
jgi:flagellar P-ring protein precursor FlgI